MMKRCIAMLMMVLAVASLRGQEALSTYGYAHGSAKSTQRLTLPFFDDFSNCQGAPSAARWASTSPFVNQDYGSRPPTVGVVTLDAVDADGRLHSGAGVGSFGGDTLLSQVVRLDSVFSPMRKRLQSSDSVYLSFYYLPGGGSGNMWERDGDEPEGQDSLVLEFYNPTTAKWTKAWGRGGTSVDSLVAATHTAWQYVTIAVVDPAYFSSDFRFRFRNLCSLDDMSKTGLIGNCDHWHLDYVRLDYARTRGDQRTFDVAFVEKAPMMLKGCVAMPARQYRASDMRQTLELTMTNLYATPVAARYTYTITDESGNVVHQYDGGNDNVPCYFPGGTYHSAQAHTHPALNYQFPTGDSHRRYAVTHVVRGSVSPDDYPQNDTLRFEQVLADYYAYDDGVGENGYGLTSTASRVKLAYGFDLREADTLTAIDICFNHTRNDETDGLKFYLCVWASSDGKPGALLYKDSEKRKVELEGLNKFHRYVLEQELVVEGPVFVGLEQTTPDYLNIGFDRSHDAREHMYYQTSGSWQQSVLKGALMMRPYFGHAATVGVDNVEVARLKVYPNPARNEAWVDGLPEGAKVVLLDAMGRTVRTLEGNRIDLGGLRPGVYLVRATCGHATTTTTRLIVR